VHSSRVVAAKKLWLVLLVAGLAGSVLLAAPAAAEDVRVNVTVSHASSREGPIERRELLPRGFDVGSHRVVQSRTLRIEMGQEARHELPNGSLVKLRPSERRENDLMMHVEVEGATTADLRMRNGKRVTIRVPQPYQGGNLLVHLEPRF